MGNDGVKVEHQPTAGGGKFFVNDDAGAQLAELTYSRGPEPAGVITINHTRVDQSLRGRGVARQLVDEAVAFARAERLQIKPVCEYARSVFDKEPALSDLLWSP